MKIGIITFWWSQDNYGQLLQCYALQKFLRDLGHDVYLIKYGDWKKDVKKKSFAIRCIKLLNPIKLYKYLQKRKNNNLLLREQLLNNRHFDDFRKKYINTSSIDYNSYTDLKNTPPQADMYIVGSDQVWNYWYKDLSFFYNPYHAFFLDFGSDKTKRISYAASWGVTELPDYFKESVKPLLAKFDYVSVREESGIELCNNCGRKDAEWVCDPTLLLNAEKYRLIYHENTIRKQKSKFILLYMLKNKCDFDIQYVYKFAEAKKLEIVYVTGNGVIDEKDKFFATIPEWLYLIDNAEYIITNSFHCAVFSIIFMKQFGVLPLSGIDIGMNSRFDSLFEFLGTGCRYIKETDFSILEENYEKKSVQISQKFLNALI